MSGGGFSESFGFSRQKSRSTDVSSSFVDPSQQPFLDAVRGIGLNVGSQQLNRSQSLFNTSGNLFNQGQDILSGFDTPSLSEGFATQSFAPQQIGAVQSLLNRNLQENLLPSIRDAGIAGGTLGGERGQLGAGVAIRGTQEALANTSADILAQDLSRQQGAAGAADAFRQRGLQSQFAGLGGLQNILNNPFGTQQSALLSLVQAIGQPTVLDERSASSRSRGFSQNRGIAGNVSFGGGG